MERAVLLYDDDCSFCRWLVAKILVWDRHRRLRPVALQDAEADVLLLGISPERKMDSWHLVVDRTASPTEAEASSDSWRHVLGGRVYSAGAGIAPLVRLLPWGRPLAILATLFPGVTEWLYRAMAKRRDWLGARLGLGPEACPIDRGPLPRAETSS